MSDRVPASGLGCELLTNLRLFNRKERYFLVGLALDNQRFRLGSGFRQQLEAELGLCIPVDAYAAMDYHLDWLYASLFLAQQPDCRAVFDNKDELVSANQEDADFLVAYREGEQHHLVLVEAKASTAFTNSQLRSKAKRLRAIFGEAGDRWPGVTPHFVLASPRQPQRLELAEWPAWMLSAGKVAWIRLPMPEGLVSVTRCDSHGAMTSEGGCWKVY